MPCFNWPGNFFHVRFAPARQILFELLFHIFLYEGNKLVTIVSFTTAFFQHFINQNNSFCNFLSGSIFPLLKRSSPVSIPMAMAYMYIYTACPTT
jgi:hypothetical protein